MPGPIIRSVHAFPDVLVEGEEALVTVDAFDPVFPPVVATQQLRAPDETLVTAVMTLSAGPALVFDLGCQDALVDVEPDPSNRHRFVVQTREGV